MEKVYIIMENRHFTDSGNYRMNESEIYEGTAAYLDEAEAQRQVDELNASILKGYSEYLAEHSRRQEAYRRSEKQYEEQVKALKDAGVSASGLQKPQSTLSSPRDFEEWKHWVAYNSSYYDYEVMELAVK